MPSEKPYQGQNQRAAIWGTLYFVVWLLQRLWCHLGLPDHCELSEKPLEVLTDLVVLFGFSLAQAWWCDLLEASRFEDTLKMPWLFGVIFITPLIISALGRVNSLEAWDIDHEGEDFRFSSVRTTLFIFGLIAAVFIVSWHFARAWLTLPGMELISGPPPPDHKADEGEENLLQTYAVSRFVIVTWSILFVSFLLVEDDGFDYRGALLAWVLSLIAVFPHPVSNLWLGVTTGIFLQGIGSTRLRFLGCNEA